MRLAETKIPDEFPEPQEKNIYHGAGSFEEIEKMPTSFEHDALVEPFSLADAPEIIIDNETKAEVTPFQVELSRKDRLTLKTIGTLALVGHKGKENLLESSRGHRKNQPQDTPKTVTTKTFRSYVQDAKAAKENGDWQGYQKALLGFADKLDARGASQKEIDHNTGLADKALAVKHERTRDELASKRQERFWLNPENVLDLKRAITEVLAKKIPDARLLGDNYPVGTSKDKLERQIIAKILEEYYGASSKELQDGKKVPMWVQEKVSDMLDSPNHKLESQIHSKKHQGNKGSSAIKSAAFVRKAKEHVAEDRLRREERLHIMARDVHKRRKSPRAA